MRITLLTHFPGKGGSTSLLIQLRGSLRELGHEVQVVVGHDSDDRELTDYVAVPEDPRASWANRLQSYRIIVEKTKPDLVYAVSGVDEFDLLRFLSLPRMMHSSSFEQNEVTDIPLILRQMDPFAEGHSTNTPDLLDRIRGLRWHPFEGCVAPYRLHPAFWKTDPAPPPARDWVEVCYVGRFDVFLKRANWLSRVIELCQRAGAPLRWHLYGDGGCEEYLRDQVRKNGSSDIVDFHGWTGPDELAKRLPQHDLYFLCSRSEGLPIALVEAMSCGVAAFVPAIRAGLTYALSKGGGWLYEAKSPEATADALGKVAALPREIATEKIKARHAAAELFGPAAIEQHLNHLNQVCQKLRFNGRVLEFAAARKLRRVTAATLATRKLKALFGRFRPPSA